MDGFSEREGRGARQAVFSDSEGLLRGILQELLFKPGGGS